MSVAGLKPFREAVLDRWLEAIWSSYPAEASRFLKETRDPFANPVGASYRRATGALLDGLLEDRPAEEMAAELDGLVRIRALQEMKPSQAVGVIGWLKRIARAEASKGDGDGVAGEALTEFDARVDRLLLAAFDAYMKCREEVFSIRVKELRNRSITAMERLNEWRGRRDQKAGDEAVETDP